MVRVLTNPSAMGLELLPDGWGPLTVLRRAACSSPARHALIDTGALVTGISNVVAAAYLLEVGLNGCDACVFLDEGRKLVLRRGEHVAYLSDTAGRVGSVASASTPTTQPLLLERCGVPAERRFVFFDHVHTTGTDIEMPPNATAALTLSKDVTFRDLAQGAFRMRRVGRGQRIDLLVPPEIAKLVRMHAAIGRGEPVDAETVSMETRHLSRPPMPVKDGCGNAQAEYGSSPTSSNAATRRTPFLWNRRDDSASRAESFLRDACAWAIINGLAAESLQLARLCQQSLRDVWRVAAFRVLLATAEDPRMFPQTESTYVSKSTSSAPTNSSKHAGGERPVSLLRLMDIFCERLSSEVANSIPDVEKAADVLDREARAYAACLAEGGASLLPEEREALVRLRSRALACATGSGAGGIDLGRRAHGARGKSGVTSLAAAAAERELQAEVVAEGEAEQEVEQTHEQLAEEELAVAPPDDFPREAWVRDAPSVRHWPLDALANPPGGSGRPAPPPFYPAHRFRSSRMTKEGVRPLRMPDFVMVSPNLATLHPGSRPRRLKNMNITLDWVPDRNGLRPARDLLGEAGAPLTSRQEQRLRQAFAMFDRDGDGRLDRSDLLSVLRAIDVNLIGVAEGDHSFRDETGSTILSRMAAVVAGGRIESTGQVGRQAFGTIEGDESEEAEADVPVIDQVLGCVQTHEDGRASLEQLREALQTHAFYRLRTGRYVVAVSLSEAEALRAAVHAARASESPLAVAPCTELCLRFRGKVLDSTAGFDAAVSAEMTDVVGRCDVRSPRGGAMVSPNPAGSMDYLGSIAHQCIRFLDSALQYETEEAHMLLRALQSNSMSHRRDVFSLVRHCRRRRHADWRQHSVARLFTTEDEFQLLHLRAMLARARRLMVRKQLSPADFFSRCDHDRDGFIGWNELHAGLRAIGMNINQDYANELFLFLRRGSLLNAPTKFASTETEDGPALLSQRLFLEVVEADAGPLGEWHDDDMGGGDLGAGEENADGGAGEVAEPSRGRLLSPRRCDVAESTWASTEGKSDRYTEPSSVSLCGTDSPPIEVRTDALPSPLAASELALIRARMPVSALRVRLTRITNFECVWDSASASLGTDRARASIWAPILHAASFSESFLRPASVRVCLGHYASIGIAKPNARVVASTGSASSDVVLPLPSSLEVMDSRQSRWRLTPHDTTDLELLVAASLPPPVRYTLRWSKRLVPGGTELFAWEGVPPPRHAALGVLCTHSDEPPPSGAMRCLPLEWLEETKMTPIKVWDDAGAGGARGSVWIVNSLGLIAIVQGHDPPRGPFFELNLKAIFGREGVA